MNLWNVAPSIEVTDFDVFDGRSRRRFVLVEEKSKRILSITSVKTSQAPKWYEVAHTVFWGGLTLNHQDATIKGQKVRIFDYHKDWDRLLRQQELRQRIEAGVSTAPRRAFHEIRCLVFRKAGELEPVALTKGLFNSPYFRKSAEAECVRLLHALDLVHLQEINEALAPETKAIAAGAN